MWSSLCWVPCGRSAGRRQNSPRRSWRMAVGCNGAPRCDIAVPPGTEEDIVELNADFSRRAAVHAARLPWTPSPIAGVDRRMLDRIGDEVARATSIVRYAPDSHFSAHTHGGGEEFLVLEGVFQDEHGDFPTGCYIRNPPTSSHTPGSAQGCTVFVKLWQFDPADRAHVRIDTGTMSLVPAFGRPGVELMPLFQDRREAVRLEHWLPGAEGVLATTGGI